MKGKKIKSEWILSGLFVYTAVCDVSPTNKGRNGKLLGTVTPSGDLVELPLQVLHRKSADRESAGGAVGESGLLYFLLSLSLRRRCHWSAYDPALPPCNHQSHVRKVLFQIGRPVPPAASGANSTGRITGAAAKLWECGLYKHRKKKNVKKKNKKNQHTHTVWWKPQSEGSLRFLEHRLNNELSVSDTHRGHTWWDCRGRRRELFF